MQRADAFGQVTLQDGLLWQNVQGFPLHTPPFPVTE
jgi:hypothetical protein